MALAEKQTNNEVIEELDLPVKHRKIGSNISNLEYCLKHLEKWGDNYVIAYNLFGYMGPFTRPTDYRIMPKNMAKEKWENDPKNRFRYVSLDLLHEIKAEIQDIEMFDIRENGNISPPKDYEKYFKTKNQGNYEGGMWPREMAIEKGLIKPWEYR